MQRNNSKPISVLNAEVSTAAIEIKTLTVGRKQVTLAVFRQLDQEDLIDLDSNTFNGLPWGRVNYHPDAECRDYPKNEHLHIVWQTGTELRRDYVEKTWPLVAERREAVKDQAAAVAGTSAEMRDALRPYETAKVAVDPTASLDARWGARHDAARTLGLPVRSPFREERDARGYYIPTCSRCHLSHPQPAPPPLARLFTQHGVHVAVDGDDLLVSPKSALTLETRERIRQNKSVLLDWYGRDHYTCEPIDATSEMVERLRVECEAKAALLGEPLARLKRALAGMQQKLAADEAAYSARYQELEALPLLFIAV